MRMVSKSDVPNHVKEVKMAARDVPSFKNEACWGVSILIPSHRHQ
jgi:hypothetical protein